MTPHVRRKYRFISLIIAGAVSLTLIPFQSVGASVKSSSWVPKDPPSIYDPNAGPNAIRRYDMQNDVCETSTQLDCFEKIEAFIEGTWVAGTLTGRLGYGGTTEWKIPGLVNEDGNDLVEVSNSINYTGNIFHQINVYSTSQNGFRPAWESGRKIAGCPVNANNDCARYGHLQANIPFRVIYRSSWVLPTALSAKLTNAKVTVEKLSESGATRVTAEGTPLIYQGVADEADVTNPEGRGAWLSQEFAISMVDGRFYPVKKECIEKPTMVIADNSYGHPLPEFIDNKLNLKVAAPHFRPKGGDKHLGVYEAFIPLETAQCLWGSTITADSVFAVEVLNPDTGAPKDATPSFSVTENGFLITARDFTYSKPTIRVAPKSRPKKPTRVTVSASRKTLSTSFARVTGTKYSVTATKAGVTKKLKCKTTRTRVNCSVRNLKKGTWRLSITPTKDQVKGIAYTKRVKIK